MLCSIWARVNFSKEVDNDSLFWLHLTFECVNSLIETNERYWTDQTWSEHSGNNYTSLLEEKPGSGRPRQSGWASFPSYQRLKKLQNFVLHLAHRWLCGLILVNFCRNLTTWFTQGHFKVQFCLRTIETRNAKVLQQKKKRNPIVFCYQAHCFLFDHRLGSHCHFKRGTIKTTHFNDMVSVQQIIFSSFAEWWPHLEKKKQIKKV